MTTVYVVTTGSYSDYGIVAIFSTRETAEMLIRNCPEGTYPAYNDIEEYELDKFEEQIKQGKQQWWVRMRENGTVDTVQEESPPIDIGVQVFNTSHDGVMMIVTTWADNKEHAIKIANERRSALIASNQWEAGYRSDVIAPISGNEPMISDTKPE